jgi:purine-cytosine permease-like protein
MNVLIYIIVLSRIDANINNLYSTYKSFSNYEIKKVARFVLTTKID